jgi:preprotein translocase subunit SecG
MILLPLLAVGFIMKVVAGLFILCSVILVLVVLVQKGRGGGLTAALGGGMASGILGSKTGDFLTWVTIVLVGVFLSLAVVLAKFYKPTVSDYDIGPSAPVTQPAEVNQPADLTPESVGDDAAAPVSDVQESADINSPVE